MLSVDEALGLIAEYTPQPTVVKIPLNDKAIGCVLAEDIKAPENVPAFRASIVDGYAVRIIHQLCMHPLIHYRLEYRSQARLKREFTLWPSSLTLRLG